MSKEKMYRELLERYLSTGKVGFTRPKDDHEAIDLIEAVVSSYQDKPVTMTLAEMSNKFKDLLNF